MQHGSGCVPTFGLKSACGTDAAIWAVWIGTFAVYCRGDEREEALGFREAVRANGSFRMVWRERGYTAVTRSVNFDAN